MERLEKETRFDFLDLNSLVWILKGIFSKPSGSDKIIIESELPQSFFLLKRELLTKIQAKNIYQCEFLEIAIAFTTHVGESKTEIIEALSEKVFLYLEKNPNLVETDSFLNILTIYKALCLFDTNEYSKELFKSLNSRVFVSGLITEEGIFERSEPAAKAEFIKTYLFLAKKFSIFEVVFLDSLVLALNQEVNIKHY